MFLLGRCASVFFASSVYVGFWEQIWLEEIDDLERGGKRRADSRYSRLGFVCAHSEMVQKETSRSMSASRILGSRLSGAGCRVAYKIVWC